MTLDFALTDEHNLVRTSVRSMLQRYIPRLQEFRELGRKEKKFPEELWEAYAEVGLTGCLVPEEYGGNNMGLLAMALGFEELTSNGFSPGLLLTMGMNTACIARNGSDEQKQRFLPRIADGSWKLCFAVTEPDAGTNTFRIQTVAKRNGDNYVVNGQKMFISGFDAADYMLLVARTTTLEELEEQGKPKSHGMSLFLVDTKSKGIEMQPIAIPLSEELNQYQLFFDNLEVPAENLLGQEDQGAIALFNSLNPERILAAAICTGMAEHALKKAVAYANERKVFKDTPIGAYQSIAHPLAEVKIDLEAARLMMHKAAWAFDQGQNPVEVGSYANMAKFLAADLAIKAVDHAIETFGGLGFAEETGLITQWTGARLLKTAPVSREMILNYVAEANLGLPKSY
ncbi:MAG: acyl-CoA dehydrogenase family protein [Dehalococcoidia bacterium]|nr:acyl-CoA dehydrogenase family protein [Dehalococcoidia bacterium]